MPSQTCHFGVFTAKLSSRAPPELSWMASHIDYNALWTVSCLKLWRQSASALALVENSVLCSRCLRLWTLFFSFFFFVFRSRTTRRYIRHGRRLPADEATSSKNATLQRRTPETHVLLQQRLSEVLAAKEGIAPTSALRHTTNTNSIDTIAMSVDIRSLFALRYLRFRQRFN